MLNIYINGLKQFYLSPIIIVLFGSIPYSAIIASAIYGLGLPTTSASRWATVSTHLTIAPVPGTTKFESMGNRSSVFVPIKMQPGLFKYVAAFRSL